jgi:hypothetical protein
VKTGTTERILPHAKPTSVQITHAGIATVEQYDLRMP